MIASLSSTKIVFPKNFASRVMVIFLFVGLSPCFDRIDGIFICVEISDCGPIQEVVPVELAKKEKRDNLRFADIDEMLIAYAEIANSAVSKVRLWMPIFNELQSELLYSDFRDGWLVGERQRVMHTHGRSKSSSWRRRSR
jgi:hypothetical protein